MLAERVIPLLIRDFQFRESEDFLRQGVCPCCGKKELYTPREHPWVLKCGRLNKCGCEIAVKELYPDLFTDWSRQFPATEKNPNAAADAYLSDARGFRLDLIRDLYTQESYVDHATGEGTATVRFSLAGGAAWERFIDRPERFGSQKARFIGSYKGTWWQAPSPIKEAGQASDEIWIVEGIFDAIALAHHGLCAASIMSCVNYPDKPLAALAAACASAKKPRPDLVFALDADPAGKRYIKKFVARAREEGWRAFAALCPAGKKKLDWNDLHLADRLSRDDLARYRQAGKILLAESAQEKGALLWQTQRQPQFPFDFSRRLYWFKLDPERFAKAMDYHVQGDGMTEAEAEWLALKETATTHQICNCLPIPLYFLANPTTGEAWYYFRVEFPHDGASIQDTFTPAQLSGASEFKKRLLSFPGAVWTGNSQQLDRAVERWTFNIKRVETLEFLGYSLAHKAWIFNDVAVADGKVIEQNDEDFFELAGGKISIRSLAKNKTLAISRDLPARGWFVKFVQAFGLKGVIALGYWLGCLFAEQIRDRYESWPFLEIVGEPGAGKTTLLEVLWKLLGRGNYEGFDPMKASSVGFLRTMAQFSNLPVVLIESDREESDGARGRARQQFHWDSLKSLYNGGSLRTTGVKSGGSDTHDPQFRAALVISQNNPVQASTAIMERIVHIGYDKSHLSDSGAAAAAELSRMETRELSGWILSACAHEKAILANLEKRISAFENRLQASGLKNRRLQKNYAMLMAMIEALPMTGGIKKDSCEEAMRLLARMALERESELSRDHPIVERFWEVYDYLNGAGFDTEEDHQLHLTERLNHSRDPALIAVNLNHFVQLAQEHRQQTPDLAELKKYLKTSAHRHLFVDANVVVSSAINARWNANAEIKRPASIRCWLFKK